MGLEKVRRAGEDAEEFGPVRLGPQDLRDVAAVFADLDDRLDLRPGLRTHFLVLEHRTHDIEDVLGYADADTLPSIHALSASTHLSFHASQGSTTITRMTPAGSPAERQAVEEAVERLRQIVRSRQLTRLQGFRQRGPGRLTMVALFAVPALVTLVGQAVVAAWFGGATSQAVASGLVLLSIVPLFVLGGGRWRDLIRLRGRDLPWWERRLGLLALLGLAVAVVVPLVVFALERGLG